MDWQSTCEDRLRRACAQMAKSNGAFSRPILERNGNELRVRVEDRAASATYCATIAPTHPGTHARNNWNPPPDQWVDLPIIDKAYNMDKLNLFRYGRHLEASLTASRTDDSPRSPPVPAWLKPYVDVFKPALEECLAMASDDPPPPN